MTTPRDIAMPLDRVTWRDGQTLASQDVRDDQSYNDRLRRLHIRYLHQTWGVVEGFRVFANGGSAVIVGAGYAIDVEGGELLLPRDTAVPTPANITAPTTMYLVISRAPVSSGCAGSPDVATLCPGAHNSIALQQGLLAWKTVNQVRNGTDVLLARVLIQNGFLASAVDNTVARRAASKTHPFAWSDTTQPGSTGWRNVSGTLHATVDISDGGFLTAPACFATLYLPSLQPVNGYVESVTRSQFTYVVRPGNLAVASLLTNSAQAENAGWTISWIAVELPMRSLYLLPINLLKGISG